MYLTDLVPKCEVCYGDIIIEMLDESGVAKMDSLEVYSYYYGTGEIDDGWYNDETELIGTDIPDVFFPVGQGFWVTGVDGTTWCTSGEVFDADKSIPLADNKQMLANPYPTSIFLARDIAIDCDVCYGDVIIEMLDESGVAKMDSLEVYSYYYGTGEIDDGWYNDETELIGTDIDDVEVPAGTGLWVTGVDGTSFQITSPLK